MADYFAELRAVVEEAGLTCEARPRVAWSELRASGELDGQPVAVEAIVGRDRNHVVMSAPIAPALDLGLRVRRVTVSLGLGLSTGSEGFDAEHDVRGDEPDRVRALLDAGVRGRIEAIAQLGGSLEVDDARAMVVQALGFLEVEETLRALTALVRALRERHAAIAPAGPLSHAAVVWGAHALRHGLTSSASPLCLSGPGLSATTARTGEHDYLSTVRVTAEPPLAASVSLRPAGLLEPLWELVKGRDVQVGDASFDRAFTIAADDADAARALLGPEVRPMLMALRRLGLVHLRDSTLVLETRRWAEVPAAIDEMRATLDAAARSLRAKERSGPYR